jgi:hypothetical protein
VCVRRAHRPILHTFGRILDPTSRPSQIYEKVAQKVLEKGPEYVQNELARLTSIMGKGSLLPKARKAFQLKHNVLSAYHRVAVDHAAAE